MRSKATVLRRCTVASLLVLGLGLGNCKGSPPPPSQPPPDRYAMRGIVVQLASAGSTDVLIRHEAVPGFRDEFGKVRTMPAMTMPFTPGPGVSVQDLKVGDKVGFTLDVDWPHITIVVSRISRLPADTVLDFAPPTAHP